MTSCKIRLMPKYAPWIQQIRFKFTRGKPPEEAPSLKQKIAELEYKDPELYFKVDIGLPVKKFERKDLMKQWMKEVQAQRQDPEMERRARLNQLLVDLDKTKEDWLMTLAPLHNHRIANHYGIFDDLFEDAYFHPVVPLTIDYDFGNEENLARVYTGNVIRSHQAANSPQVKYTAEPDTLWTLLLTTPDANLSGREFEYCHWFIGNIPGSDVTKGEVLVDYLRPIPPRGIGYCRYIFVLYKQDKAIDFSEYKKEQPCLNLVERNWKTYDFYRKHQDNMTPAGLAFFQCDYDKTLKEFYHHTLDMEEPVFEYDFPPPHLRKQEWFPKRLPFNIYLDKYRDKKQINKEFLLRILKKEHPFKFPEPPLKYPNAVPWKGYVPSWLKTEMVKERMGWGRINDYK